MSFGRVFGGPAYQKTRPMITSLWNKYRLSLVNNNVQDAEHVAWVMTAQAAIDGGTMYESADARVHDGLQAAPPPGSIQVFGQFSLKSLKAWIVGNDG